MRTMHLYENQCIYTRTALRENSPKSRAYLHAWRLANVIAWCRFFDAAHATTTRSTNCQNTSFVLVFWQFVNTSFMLTYIANV